MAPRPACAISPHVSTSTDFKTLGRLGTASGTLTGGTLRRRAGIRGARTVRRGGRSLPDPRVVGGVLAAVLVVLFVLGTTAQSQLDAPAPSASSLPSMDPVLEASLMAGGTQMAATGARTLIPGGGATAGMVEVPAAFAAVEDLALHLPSREHEGVIFSEADAVDMLPLAPVGEMVSNANPAFDAVTSFEGPGYHVAEPLTGVRPATGLARILLAPGAEVLSPVTGKVVAVDEYSTADGGRDWRVVVLPATRQDLHVVIRRIDAPTVTVGQSVGVGQDVLGAVRASTARATDANPLGLPSAWISVRPAFDPDIIDPHAPAVAADPEAG